MRKRRLLLAATALSTMACSSKGASEEREPLPGNPKGSRYDAGVAPPEVVPLPGNPKGALYDAGEEVKPSPPDAAIADAASAAADATKPKVPTDAPVIRPLPGNPKGSLYDKGKKKPPPDLE